MKTINKYLKCMKLTNPTLLNKSHYISFQKGIENQHKKTNGVCQVLKHPCNILEIPFIQFPIFSQNN